MISGNDYRTSLDDGRAVWLDGKRVDDVTAHPLLRKSVDWVAQHLRRARRAAHPMYRVPASRDELREQMDVLLSSDRTAATTAGCMALATAADQLAARRRRVYGPRLERVRGRVLATEDLRVAAAIDDTARPVQIVERRADGIVIAGGKQHVVGAPVVHELLLVPSGRVDDADAAVACAVAVNTPGRAAHRVDDRATREDDRHHPVSRGHSISEAIVVFDDVFVPIERVFLAGEAAQAGALADTLSIWERARAVADQADRAELIIGLAQTISEMNGILEVTHVRDKLAAIAVWAKMCRAGWEAALANARVTRGGMVAPGRLLSLCDEVVRRAALQRDDAPSARRRRRSRDHLPHDRRPRQPRDRSTTCGSTCARWKA